MKSLRLAFSFLTTLPVTLPGAPVPGDLGRAAAWYPLVGLVIGGLVALAKTGLERIFPPLLAAGLVVAVWAFLTGGLHLDGLADSCDGLLSSAPRERRLEIMRDPRLGAFGGAGLALHLMLKVFAVYSLPSDTAVGGILLAAVAARWLILPAGRQPAARADGLGADLAQGLGRSTWLLAALLPLALAALVGWVGVLGLILAHLTAWAVFRLARSRLGGLTGDVFGLLVELAELTVLLAFSLRWQAGF